MRRQYALVGKEHGEVSEGGKGVPEPSFEDVKSRI